MTMPLQGTPNVFDPRNPTLVPQPGQPNAGQATGSAGISSLALQSPAAAVASSRTDATALVSIGGTVTVGDELTLQVANNVFANAAFGGNPAAVIAHTYTVQAGDTIQTIADRLSNLFNDDTNAQTVGLRADNIGNNITFRHNGPVGNLSTLSAILGEPSQITIGGSATANDTLAVQFTGGPFAAPHVVSITVPGGSTSANSMALALANAINADAGCIGASITATNSTSHVNLTVPAADEPITPAVFANPAQIQCTVGGSATAGDALNVTLTIAGASYTSTYSVVSTDTVNSMASGIAGAINANPQLIALGISAAAANATVSISWPPGVGQIRISKSITGAGTETLTTTGGPSETITIATQATETFALTPSNGVFSGGAGPIIPVNNFDFSTGAAIGGVGTLMSFFYGQPVTVDFVTLSALVNEAMPIV